jgi:hypothetical protein
VLQHKLLQLQHPLLLLIPLLLLPAQAVLCCLCQQQVLPLLMSFAQAQQYLHRCCLTAGCQP